MVAASATPLATTSVANTVVRRSTARFLITFLSSLAEQKVQPALSLSHVTMLHTGVKGEADHSNAVFFETFLTNFRESSLAAIG
jgi:hypothetical protein